MGNIIDKGPSVVFIKDFDGNIFGGFASTSWTVGPQFKGMLSLTCTKKNVKAQVF